MKHSHAAGALVALAILAIPTSALDAQTDFHNTDHGRPFAVEDANVLERHAWEWSAAPLRFERAARGLTRWELAPSLAWGIQPRTQLEFALPFAMADDVTRPRALTALAGVEVGLLHQLTHETERLPALALGASALLEAGPLAPRRTLAELRAAATRSFGWGRLHANAGYTPGDALAATDPAADEGSRWRAGIAIDRTFALRSLLVGAEVTARRPISDAGEVEWRGGVGVRRQLGPRIALDAGLSRRLSEGGPAWGGSFGVAYAFARPGARAFTRPRTTGSSGASERRVFEQFYLPASHNFAFRRDYVGADRLFNAFDYGHAVLYEALLTRPAESKERLAREFAYLTTTLLNRPPDLPLAEEAVEPRYAQLAPEAKGMFEWAHLLHRQVYDVLADDRLDEAAKDREMQRLEAYYRSRPDLAFSAKPKSMDLMEGQSYSLAFRQAFPEFNGLIWAYHWLQVGLYEPLVMGRTEEERQTGVAATVARFRQMLEEPPSGMPTVMPMTAAIAPEFSRRWPTLAITFDNLHSLHDVISDVLANPAVPRDRKRAAILMAARAYRDDTTEVTTVAEWLEMTRSMGVENMGGPAVGILPPRPRPTSVPHRHE